MKTKASEVLKFLALKVKQATKQIKEKNLDG